MTAVILYDDPASAAKANAMLTRAAYRADETIHWNIKPWRVNLLGQTGVANMALIDAADAHLIVICVRQQAELPSQLLVWLEQWAGHRQIQEAALAVFDGGNGDTISATAAPGLSRFAQCHGLSFVLGAGDPTQDDASAFARSLHERAVAVTPTLQQIIAAPARECHWAWGING